MKKTFNASVVSVKMNNTVVVSITRQTPHPLYRKLLTRSRNFKADTNNHTVVVGQKVFIEETRPISKDKHFKLITAPVKQKTKKKEDKSE